ncbi:MAG TPA: glycosyltransferase family A protein [Polyangiaceae bacterium]|nr:glycosyltransferase family A protein [Polyangiaceae bacterium]
MSEPFFSVIAAYYQGVSDHQTLARFVNSLQQQTFQDFEVLIYHDGPLQYEISCPYPVLATPERQNVWGHNLRQLGLQHARGRYVLHTNIDNLYEADAFAKIFARLQQGDSQILITRLRMMGLNYAPPNATTRGRIWYDKPRDYSKSVVLTGNPPVYGNIDLMQLVASKQIWDRYGWFSTVEQADGLIYPRLCKENSYACTDILIGKHY